MESRLRKDRKSALRRLRLATCPYCKGRNRNRNKEGVCFACLGKGWIFVFAEEKTEAEECSLSGKDTP